MAGNTQMLQFLKKRKIKPLVLVWVLSSAFVPLVGFLIYDLNVKQSSGTTKIVPIILVEYVSYPGFYYPPKECYQLNRWPNIFAYCEFISLSSKTAVINHYRNQLLNKDWSEMDGSKFERGEANKFELIVMFKNKKSDRYLIIEHLPNAQADKREVIYRIRLRS